MSKISTSKLSRRQLMFAGAGTVGAVAAVAALPLTNATPTATPEAKAAPSEGGGYQETQHVLRYYQTARV
jgi:hypothetical protein